MLHIGPVCCYFVFVHPIRQEIICVAVRLLQIYFPSASMRKRLTDRRQLRGIAEDGTQSVAARAFPWRRVSASPWEMLLGSVHRGNLITVSDGEAFR